MIKVREHQRSLHEEVDRYWLSVDSEDKLDFAQKGKWEGKMQLEQRPEVALMGHMQRHFSVVEETDEGLDFVHLMMANSRKFHLEARS